MSQYRTFVSFDWAIKRLFRDKANFCVLEGFLSELLHDDVTIIALIDGESNQEHSRDKFNRVDLMVKISSGEQLIIEVQYDYQVDYFQRMNYGAAKVITENMSSSDFYSEVKRVISVNIVYFDLGEGEDYLYYGRTVFDGVHRHDRLKLSDKQRDAFACEEIGQIFPEYYLIKVKSFADVTTDTLDEWIYFLRHSDILPEFKAKGLQEARQRLSIMQMSPKERAEFDAFIDDRRFQNSVGRSHIMQGIEQGRQEMAEEVAKAQAEAKTADEKRQQAQAEAKTADEKRQQAQAEAKTADEKRQQAQAEAEKAQATLEKAIALLIAAGIPEELARKQLGL
jgi:predicted transposase/invertase (TIGR01784 family)